MSGADGTKRWGLFGAAGLLAHDPQRGVLLQHRVEWSHFGGTWGIPGGAINEDETPLQGAQREAAEEAGVPDGHLRPFAHAVVDFGWWRYTTVLARVEIPFEPSITDAESLELRWVPLTEVADLPLHPGFGASWPVLLPILEREARGESPVVPADLADGHLGAIPFSVSALDSAV